MVVNVQDLIRKSKVSILVYENSLNVNESDLDFIWEYLVENKKTKFIIVVSNQFIDTPAGIIYMMHDRQRNRFYVFVSLRYAINKLSKDEVKKRILEAIYVYNNIDQADIQTLLAEAREQINQIIEV
jgi:hypothetical protein